MSGILPYDEAVKRWAAQRLSIDADSIESVEFGSSNMGCPTCGYGIGTYAEVTTADRKYGPEEAWTARGKFYEIDLHDIGDAIKEVLAIATGSEADPAGAPDVPTIEGGPA